MLDSYATVGVVKHITYQKWDDMQRLCGQTGPRAEISDAFCCAALRACCPAEHTACWVVCLILSFMQADLFWHHRLPASNWLWEAQHKGMGHSCVSLASRRLQLGSCSILASLQTNYTD